MSNPRLPPEIPDYVVALLHDNPEALRKCYPVSKLWVSRTRRLLFIRVEFRSVADLEWWKKTFPDPSDSPAYYTNALFVVCPQVIAEADAEDGSWIGAFSRVARLRVESSLDGSKVPSRHSTHSHPHSNYSAWRLPSFHPHRLSTSFVHSPSSRTCPWSAKGASRTPTTTSRGHSPSLRRLHPHLRDPRPCHTQRDREHCAPLLGLPSGFHF
jgi:hypothetical protein